MLTRSLLAGRFVTPHQAWYAAVSLKLSTGTTGFKRPSEIAWRVRFCADHPRLSPVHETETDPVDRFTGDEVCGDGPRVRPAKTNAPFVSKASTAEFPLNRSKRRNERPALSTAIAAGPAEVPEA